MKLLFEKICEIRLDQLKLLSILWFSIGPSEPTTDPYGATPGDHNTTWCEVDQTKNNNNN